MAKKVIKKKTKIVSSALKKKTDIKKSAKSTSISKPSNVLTKAPFQKHKVKSETVTSLPTKQKPGGKVGLETTQLEALRAKILSDPSITAKEKDSDICMIEGCEESKTTGDFCRLHYITKWKRLKKKEKVLAEKRLNKYIEELTSRYPDEYIEVIKRDLSSDKNFAELLQDLEIEDVDEVVGVEEDDDEFSKKFRPEDEEL